MRARIVVIASLAAVLLHTVPLRAQEISDEAALKPCSGQDLIASAGWQGATGSMVGSIIFLNRGAEPCSLTGRPTVQIVDGRGTVLPVPQTAGRDEPIDGDVVVQPEQQALVSLTWSRQWCSPSPPRPFALRIQLADGSAMDAPVREGGTPRCDAPGMPTTSVLYISAFQLLDPDR
jgi:hypothetical protein